ncbi:hypothetical protein [Streptomyces sp. NPDC060194]|uniref:SCO2195 family GlnR-regulated protein n=1 Tax=Streptomyces sp. NPDC060194 TaxID=3347069 RepID=UPI00364E9E47
MQAAPARATVLPTAPATVVRASPLPSFGATLRAVESLLLGPGQRQARRNAWTSVLEDRRRAEDRVRAQHVIEAVTARSLQG